MNKIRIFKFIFLVALILLLFFPSLTSARPEYAAKESRNCPYCHTRDGPPQLNEVGVYYVTHNHSLEGYVPTPKGTPTPEPEIEIGVHMTTWDVGLRAMAMIILILAVVYIIRL
ncbi:MAG: hypothetical protein C3F06_12215 [Candidatus Methanoperedenaceae archaeon]|nr:MAG: hypothetical protein C3F06_12215 [Candidatus Methanoperedenaceae archaeon]